MIKVINEKLPGKNNYRVSVEIYDSVTRMIVDLRKREITDVRFHDRQRERLNADWTGVKSYGQALGLLEDGYTPAVRQIYDEIMVKGGRRIKGRNSGAETGTSVAGYQPVVPLALYGVPDSMLLRKTARNEARVLNLFVDTTCSSSMTIQNMALCGMQLVKLLCNLEMCGHKINLYVCDGFAAEASADLLCIKVKNSNTPLDIRRVSFPLCHTAFQRVIAFDWYARFPAGVYREHYGVTLDKVLGEKGSARIIKRIFGPASMLVTYEGMRHRGIAYVKDALEIEKIRIED